MFPFVKFTLSSTPGISSKPLFSASSFASLRPWVVSWSVTAIALNPASIASLMSSAGLSDPSEAVVWV